MLLKKLLILHGKKMKMIEDEISALETTVEAITELNQTSVNDLMAVLRPAVGDIEINITGTNPGTKYAGTTWVEWGKGRVPVGVDTEDPDFSTVEKIDGPGEKKHVLAEGENAPHRHTGPSHTHSPGAGSRYLNFTGTRSAETIGSISGSGWKIAQLSGSGTWYESAATGAAGAGLTSSSGSAHPHNNLQPYITCYMWKRTA